MTLYVLSLCLLVTSSWAFLFVPDPPGNKPLPSQNFSYHQQLDDNYELYWDFNDTHIIFETHVKTNGYIGLGLSPNGGMKDADIVIGWVKDGQPHFSDRHGVGFTVPVVDSQQDWTLLGAAESGDYTSLKMVRRRETCDTEDRPILLGTTRVIYSYHPVDPVNDDSVQYHGAQSRGSKSILLLDPPTSEQDVPTLPDGVKTFDLVNKNYSVPSDDTTYHCVFLKLPDLGHKHHMIRFEPLIQKGHEKLLHHIVLYTCTKPFRDDQVGESFLCQNFQIPDPRVLNCNVVLLAWAVGGTAYNLPPDIGQPMGGPGDPVYFRMETHYDNPDMRSDFVDNSGLRIFLTDNLRKHDAGTMETGILVDRFQVIPPHEQSWLSAGYCSETCLEKALGDQEIRVFATFLHAHLLGVKLRTRHFRDGVELPPLQEDNSYDFDYQEIRPLYEERIVKKGDLLLTECEYDSTGRSNVTWGGLSTREEMCESFLWYYPKVPLSLCLSRPTYESLNFGWKHGELARVIDGMDFSKKQVRETFKNTTAESSLIYICHGDRQDLDMLYWKGDKPNITSTHQPPKICAN